MLEMVKARIIFGLYAFLSMTKLGNLSFLKNFYYEVKMARLMRKDQYAWNKQVALDKGVKIGKNTWIFGGVNYSVEPYLIEIGDNCVISGNVTFETHDGGIYLFNDGSDDILGNFGKIKIGNNCFLGARSIFLPDVEIGDNCLVAVGSVVANSFGDNSLIMGNPAKLVSRIEYYRKAKMVSKNTVRHPRYGMPNQGKIPKEEKRKLLLEHFADLPIRKARKKMR